MFCLSVRLQVVHGGEQCSRAQDPVKFQMELGVGLPAILREYGLWNAIDERLVSVEIFFNFQFCDFLEGN